ncbi:MAG: DNA/RNA non-specific endonuclease [Clostridia bacterium]|nr:DNA/RNA non-specific endonuclease [Clostridia bacterium]
MKRRYIGLILALGLLLSLLSGCGIEFVYGETTALQTSATTEATSASQSQNLPQTTLPLISADTELPEYNGIPYVALNGNIPDFKDEQLITTSYEYYSELDYLGRCGYTEACIGLDIMPTEDRGNISHVKPTGWHSVQYDNVDGKSFYNRCHLIGFQLTGENANVGNLITGTRYMNVDGMLPFEDLIADYVKETGNHVLYRVTPVFVDDELVARGVIMEGFSVEDEGDGVCFNIFAFNVQPGIEIDYQTGESRLLPSADSPETSEDADYVLNTNSKKFHLPTCSSVTDMNPNNREDFQGTRDELVLAGYSPCGSCKP